MLKKGGDKKRGRTFAGLEQLFGSKTRFGLLKLFCQNKDRKFFMRELARLADNQLNAVRREISNLEGIGIIQEMDSDDSKKKFYQLNTNFVLIDEISSLIAKSELLAEKNLVGRITGMGNIDLCILTGALLGVQAPCDILVVGRINKDAMGNIIRKFEAEMRKTITYTILAPEEYKQRKALTDKFLFGILESKKIVAIDKQGEFAYEKSL